MKERAEVIQSDKWNVESLYLSLDVWEEDFKKIAGTKALPRWPKLVKYKGRLHEGESLFKDMLDTMLSLERNLEKLYSYAHLRHDEAITLDTYKDAYMRISEALHDFRQEIAWVEPEILALSAQKLEEYLRSPQLKIYKFFLEKIIRMRPHTLSADKEELLAMAGMALGASPKAFSALNNADIKFQPIKDKEGNTHELSHALYQLYLRSPDRTLRREAFKEMHRQFRNHENTLAELINGQMQSHVFSARARKFSSSLQAALYPSDIDESVYTSLIKTVRANLTSLHRYIQLRKRVLNLPEIHLYDMYFPLVQEIEINTPYEEAVKKVVESVAPLGEEYQRELRYGLERDGWVDKYENQGKRSGAYSSGCYDSHPFILMNYRGALRDVFTLAHEAGHSMHSLLAKKHQPYHDSHYTIFVAEVASTFNEELLMDLMLKTETRKEVKIYLINEKLEDIRATFFRQTMFAEFELLLHSLVEKGIPLTPGLLKEKYYQLNKDYFGPDAFVDEEAAIEWARIPHFYYNFYVYQYATGISAAFALVENVLKGDLVARDHYLNFLKSGGNDFPINLLKQAGVDMSAPTAIEATIRHFDHLVNELDRLISTPS